MKTLSFLLILLLQTLFLCAQSSSSRIRVYFTRPVNQNISPISDGIYVAAMEDTVVAYINRAQHSLDVCVFDNNSENIVAAINAAAQRGVQVRYITSAISLNSALDDLDAQIPFLERSGVDAMHNKFLVIDAAYTQLAKVWTGSTNFTEDNMSLDPNSVVIIQDSLLAAAYKLEFEEMWGSTGNMPDTNNSKFGPDKSDNTPHEFVIDGKRVELYFSPSDGTSSHIETALQSAQQSLEFALFTFIHNDLGDRVVALHQAGVAVKGIIENINYFGSEYNHLVSAGIQVLAHNNIPNSFHHKYAVVDANSPSSDPAVIVGSHNWSNSAEEDYDENLLIIHDSLIAAQYYEEFMTRFEEILLEAENGYLPFVLYPNPSAGTLNISEDSLITGLELLSLEGKSIATWNANFSKIEFPPLPSGTYILRIFAQNQQYHARIGLK